MPKVVVVEAGTDGRSQVPAPLRGSRVI